MITKSFQKFMHKESSSGIVLLVMTALALFLANGSLAPAYSGLLAAKFSLGPLTMSFQHWVNDGLMALFFLLVGLEIKRELLHGTLSVRAQALLPAAAAVGGMLVPMLVYVIIVDGHPEYAAGWAIPAATDIAFALGILALLGPRVPVCLKVFLTALAILDDIGAVLIITFFYNAALDILFLAAGAGIFAALLIMNRLKVMCLVPYLLLGVVLWAVILQSGLHATIAGVLLALCIPLTRDGTNPDIKITRVDSPLLRLEHILRPWALYAILPLFAVCNAGLDLSIIGGVSAFTDTLPLAIALGLFIGKPVGIFGAAWLAVRCRIAALPADTGFIHIAGAGLLGGVGFTMSLFIGALAFADSALVNPMKLGVLAGSFLSAIAGLIVCRVAILSYYGGSTKDTDNFAR
ncbi:MAG: Na+/H+ antiporter NhaA [Bdellovibrionales bacterium]